jgi:predicted dehydrogenase
MITQVRHAPEYARDPRAEIALVWDLDLARAKQLADKYGAAVADSPEALWGSSRVDAVSVCTPNHFHGPQTLAALAAGKHVLCEKPMASGLDEARSMVEAARKANRLLMLGHNQRFAPAHQAGRSLIAAGAIGRILSFRSHYRHGGPEKWGVNKTAATWFFDKTRTRYGVLGDLGTHKIDLVRFLTGQDVAAVQAWLGTVHKTKVDGTPIDLEDEATIRLRMASGLVGTVDVSWCHYGLQDNVTVVNGDKGVLTMNPEDPSSLVLETADGVLQRQTFGHPWGSAQDGSGVIREFLDALEAGRQPLVTGLDGLAAVEVIEASITSAASGTWQDVRHGL